MFTALGSSSAMGPFATAGLVMNAFSVLSSMFGSSGPSVESIIIKSLNEIRSILREIQVQLNRIENNQVITYDAIVRLIEEFRTANYQVQLSLQQIKDILLLQIDTEIINLDQDETNVIKFEVFLYSSSA
jgi:hypothetical protein